MNVDKMLREITAEQLHEWMVFAQLEPFGGGREDARAASIVQVLTNVHRDRKRHPAPVALHQCVLSGGDAFETVREPKADWRHMKAIAMLMTTASHAQAGRS